MVLDKDMVAFFDSGLFPASFIDNYTLGKGYSKQGIIRNLQSRGYLEKGNAERKKIGEDRLYCYLMAAKLVSWLDREKGAELPVVAGGCVCP